MKKLDKVSAKVNEIRKQNRKEEEDFAATDRRIVCHFPVFLKEIEQQQSKGKR